MNRVFIIADPFKKNEYTYSEVDDVCEYLQKEFKTFPEKARIYHKSVASKNDVTPTSVRSIKRLQSLEGDFYVVIYPDEPISIAMWIVMAITAAFSIYTYATMPKIKAQANESPNNELGDRQNQVRLGGRVPEILGNPNATPDLIANPYFVYENGRKIEYQLLCIGVGYFEIHRCRDGETDVEDISGTSVAVFDPGVAINTNNTIYSTGEAFTDLPLAVSHSDSINGQSLQEPNDTLIESSDLYFEHPNLIKSRSTIDFTQTFAKDDNIELIGADFGILDAVLSGQVMIKTNKTVVIESDLDLLNPNNYQGLLLTGALVEIRTMVGLTEQVSYKDVSGQYQVSGVSKSTTANGFHYVISLLNALNVNPNWQFIKNDQTINAGVTLNKNTNSIILSDSYSIDRVTTTQIELKNPSLVNSDWAKLNGLPNQSTIAQTADIALDKITNKWVGWHTILMRDAESITFNLFFPNGLWRQTSRGGVSEAWQTALIEYQSVDVDGVPFGHVYTHSKEYRKSEKVPFGETITISLPIIGGVRFRICKTNVRIAPNVQTDVKVEDVFASMTPQKATYENWTVVRSKVVGTDGAMSVKSRKLNFNLIRKLKLNGEGALTATTSGAQALIHLALDAKNGRRTINEIDIDQILAEEQWVNEYFGSTDATGFTHTIDDNNLSFEEMAGMITSTMFCEGYRFGSKLRIDFEKPQENAVLLFNHRNKVIKSGKRTRSSGNKDGYDGVEVEYTSPIDDTRVTYIASDVEFPLNTMQIKTSGIRNEAQAKTRAWREWNKIKYQYLSCEFTAMDESEILRRNNKILVADSSNLKTQDGEVLVVDGLVLTLSQETEMTETDDYFIQLQIKDATVDIIEVRPGEFTDQVILTRPPLLPLVVEDGKFIKTTYQIVVAEELATTAFIMSEMSRQSDTTNTLKCVNYTDQYYEKDHSFF
ncbi:host specificity factor TipJ family phage tail protein [Acinetobacter sp. TY2]|uniref:host specificity factor TipJ family phage tail protein n=1 Tax=Acinetobacter sp. TY2 TaxID=3387403 RepID=UPI0039179556